MAGSCCGLGLKPETRNRASPCPSAWTACGFGAQAFNSASAFNANIGAWNTAAVNTLYGVCAAPGPAARTMADALGRGFDAARPVVRGGTADARARAHTCRHALARGLGCRYGRAEARFDACIRIDTCRSVCVAPLHIHFTSICIFENRPGLCMRAPVRDGDGSAVCARVGGLVLWARPKRETLNRASPCPSASTTWWLRRAGARRYVGVQRQHRRVEHRGRHRLVRCMRRSWPCGGVLWRTRSAGPRGGAAGCARRHRRCARACAHVSALACAGPWV